jgi:RNA polymerase sigma-70 factor (ECF subfamily)
VPSGRSVSANPDVSELLEAWSKGDQAALETLIPLVQGELRRLAHGQLRRARSGHLLQTTALVNEAYLRLVDQRVEWRNRSHFFGIAARLMRRIVVDEARSRLSAKRGGGVLNLVFDEALSSSPARAREIVDLDEALDRLAKLDARQARLVELRYFGGLTVEETAEVLDISPATVKREWMTAKAWLRHELKREGGT